MNCKYCNAEMEKGMEICPICGAAQAEPEAEQNVVDTLLEEALDVENPEEEASGKRGLGAGKIALLVILAVAAIAVVVALIMGGNGGKKPVETTPTQNGASALETIPPNGDPDTVACKGSYSAADGEVAAAANTVVATMGDAKLTNGELQVYYWMQVYDFLNEYGGYASMFGLDYTQPMDRQMSIEGTMTWQQYFLDSALDTWVNYQAMCHDAKANGYVLEKEYEDYLAELPNNLAQSAVSMGYESAEAMVQGDMGAGASLKSYLSYLNNYYLGYMYYGDVLEQMEVTAEEVEAYFDVHADEYLENGLEKNDETYVDVRHILIAPEGGTTDSSGSTTYSDAEWAAAEAKANELLNAWLAGDATEESFAELASAYSVDGGSSANGGLYEDVYVGQMVEPFENWCFDDSRQYGDYGIVKTNYGYHIMFFVSSDLVWYLTAESDMMVERGNVFLEETVAKYPAKINYSAIVLGNVDLATAE